MSEPDDPQRAARYSDLFAAEHGHSPECAYCPICASIAVVRKTRPEVLDHLARAAREFIAAAGLLLEEAEAVIGSVDQDGEDAGSHKKQKIRRIDVV